MQGKDNIVKSDENIEKSIFFCYVVMPGVHHIQILVSYLKKWLRKLNVLQWCKLYRTLCSIVRPPTTLSTLALFYVMKTLTGFIPN